MEAGLFYTLAGPWLIAGSFLLFVFVSFRSALSGPILFSAYLLLAPFLTYRLEFQAVGAAIAIVTLAAAALVRNPPRTPAIASPVDRAMLLFTVLIAVAAVVGLVAGNSHRHLAADLFHYVVVGSLLYFAIRRLVPRERIEELLDVYLILALGTAVLVLALLYISNRNPALMWLIGQPLDDRTIQLKADWAFPLLPLVIASAWTLRKTRPVPAVAIVLLACVLTLTYKRTLWVATAVAMGAMLVAALWARGGTVYPRRLLWRQGGLLVALLVVGIGLSRPVGIEGTQAIARAAQLLRPATAETARTRTAELADALPYVVEKPLGHGLGAAPRIPRDDPAGRPTHYVHNVYVQFSIQGGLQTLVAVLGLLAAFWGRLWSRRDEPAALALGGSVAGLAAAGLAVLSFYTPMFWFLLALGATLAERPRD